jgi:hypothetical protein
MDRDALTGLPGEGFEIRRIVAPLRNPSQTLDMFFKLPSWMSIDSNFKLGFSRRVLRSMHVDVVLLCRNDLNIPTVLPSFRTRPPIEERSA